MIIEAEAVFVGGLLAPGWVEVAGDRIRGAGHGAPPRRAQLVASATVIPGFVDAHVHGGGGYSFEDPGDAADRIAAVHLHGGTTSIMASLVTAPLDELTGSIQRLADKVREGVLAGIHLEGPWLSPAHRGAHAPELLRPPNGQDVGTLLRAGAGTVRMVTLAPELDGGLEAVSAIVKHGAVAAIGHTDASYEQARQAVLAGATVGTHVFNGMRSMHHRQPGPVAALLEDPRVFVELIADGVHLHPAIIRVLFASNSRPVLVTDAMAAAGAPDGSYKLGGLDVDVTGGRATLVEGGSIAGSTLTMDAALRYAVQVAGIPLVDVIKAGTQNPADMLGLTQVGRIEEGRRADLVLLDPGLNVLGVMRAGVWAVPPHEESPRIRVLT